MPTKHIDKLLWERIEQKKVIKKTIYSFLVFGFSTSILHIYLYSGFF